MTELVQEGTERREDAAAAQSIPTRSVSKGPQPWRRELPGEFSPLDRACREIVKHGVNDRGLSARTHDKILRFSRFHLPSLFLRLESRRYIRLSRRIRA